MPKHAITVFGILVAIMPFLGFPGSFKAPVYFVLGGAIAYLSFQEHRDKRKHHIFRRIRKPKEAVTIQVNGGSEDSTENTRTVTNLVESNEESKPSI